MKQNARIRHIAVKVMRQGEARVSEVARALRMSNQIVAYWAKAERINVAAARARRVAQLLRIK